MSLILIVAGIYFLSSSFIEKLNDSSAVKISEVFEKNKKRAKGSAYISIALGALTLVWAIMFITFPQILQILALLYMVALFISCIILIALYK